MLLPVGDAPKESSGGYPDPAEESPALLPLKPETMRSRLGVGWPRNGIPPSEELVRGLGFGWYLDWGTLVAPLAVEGLEFVQIVPVRDGYSPSLAEEVAAAVQANPAALWLLGNEPDVPWQGNKTPEEYAEIYHRLYHLIKSSDPSAKIGLGGVSQVTPLRLAYLERVLQAYEQRFGQPLPVDVWNIHAFVLREEQDSWGVSIPPGFDVQQGMLYEIEDHDDIEIFKQEIIDFRRWLAQLGQRDKPLIVSEYGILMPEGYGFPPEAVIDFMVASFDFLLNAQDPEIGYPADDNRLVQRLAWFSLGYDVYPTGNLVDLASGELTPLGQAFAQYAASLEAPGALESPPGLPATVRTIR
jgi:hypothetical protein